MGLPSFPVFCGQGPSLFPVGSEPHSGGSHWINVTGLMLCPEKQKTSPPAKPSSAIHGAPSTCPSWKPRAWLFLASLKLPLSPWVEALTEDSPCLGTS